MLYIYGWMMVCFEDAVSVSQQTYTLQELATVTYRCQNYLACHINMVGVCPSEIQSRGVELHDSAQRGMKAAWPSPTGMHVRGTKRGLKCSLHCNWHHFLAPSPQIKASIKNTLLFSLWTSNGLSCRTASNISQAGFVCLFRQWGNQLEGEGKYLTGAWPNLRLELPS